MLNDSVVTQSFVLYAYIYANNGEAFWNAIKTII